MRLQGVHDGFVYVTDHRRLFRETARGFEEVGRLPLPGWQVSSVREWLTARRDRQAAIGRFFGRFPTVNVWRLTADRYLATSGRWVFRSGDAGRTWRKRKLLPPTSGPMGVLPTGVCYRDGSVFLGEYPRDGSATPRIRRSEDFGRSWETVGELSEVRHVHGVQTDPYTDDLWITTGDEDSECYLMRLCDGELSIVGGGSQRWRAVELVFTPSAVLWGVDCPYVESKPILRLDRSEIDSTTDADLETLHTVSSPVFYGRAFDVDGDGWVAFSTAATPRSDSTGPSRSRRDPGSAKVVVSPADSDFTEWFDLAEYRKRTRPVDYLGPDSRLPNSNAYVFLGADASRGLLVNPYNTASADGVLIEVPAARFRELGRTQLR